MEKTKEKLISKHIEDWSGLQLASIENFFKTGKVSGTFFIALKDMMDEYAQSVSLIKEGEEYWQVWKKKEFGGYKPHWADKFSSKESCEGKMKEVGDEFDINYFEHYEAKLIGSSPPAGKELKDITDEDLKEVKKLSSKYRRVIGDTPEKTKYYLLLDISNTACTLIHTEVYQYLQSKGYKLPKFF